MGLIKKRSVDGGAAEVTFRLPSGVHAEQAFVVGDFNDWSMDAHEMKPAEEGFVATIVLETGRSYRFRYLLDGQRWENDWAADAYLPNDFGGDDSVVDLVDIGEIIDDATGTGRAKTRPELYDEAKRRNLPGRSKMGRDELARALGDS